MPYVKQEARTKFEQVLKELIHAVPETPGELNYLFSVISAEYLKSKGQLRYQYANDVLGALEGAKLEVYRRIIAPYENKAIKENGDL